MTRPASDAPAALPIRDVRVRFFRAPVETPVQMSFSAMQARTLGLVEVESETGLIGTGETWVNYPSWISYERYGTVRHGVAPLLRGRDAADPASLLQLLQDTLGPLGRQWGAPGAVWQALSGADLAVWDLLGKTRGTSVGSMLGGQAREHVPVYASGLGPDQVSEQLRHCHAQGITSAKLRVGFDPDVDRRNIDDARALLGPDAQLMVDANQGWTLDEALTMAPALRKNQVAWVEEPILGNRLEDLEEFHRCSGLRVATGENLYGYSAFLPYIRSKGVHILQPDVSKNGGLSEAARICVEAGAHGKEVTPHLYGGALACAATLQLASAFPAVTSVEFDIRENPLRDRVVHNPPRVTSGHVAVPQDAGLGLRLDPDNLASYEVEPCPTGLDAA